MTLIDELWRWWSVAQEVALCCGGPQRLATGYTSKQIYLTFLSVFLKSVLKCMVAHIHFNSRVSASYGLCNSYKWAISKYMRRVTQVPPCDISLEVKRRWIFWFLQSTRSLMRSSPNALYTTLLFEETKVNNITHHRLRHVSRCDRFPASRKLLGEGLFFFLRIKKKKKYSKAGVWYPPPWFAEHTM